MTPTMFVMRESKRITNGFAVSNDACLEVGIEVPAKFVKDLMTYMNSGLIKLHTVRLKPVAAAEVKP